MPVIGFLHGASPEGYAPMVTAFRQGLKEAGYAAAAPRRRDRARPHSAVGGAASAVARPVAAGALFGQSLLGYISPEPLRLNGNTFPAGSLPSAAARRVRRPCVECSAFLL